MYFKFETKALWNGEQFRRASLMSIQTRMQQQKWNYLEACLVESAAHSKINFTLPRMNVSVYYAIESIQDQQLLS